MIERFVFDSGRVYTIALIVWASRRDLDGKVFSLLNLFFSLLLYLPCQGALAVV